MAGWAVLKPGTELSGTTVCPALAMSARVWSENWGDDGAASKSDCGMLGRGKAYLRFSSAP